MILLVIKGARAIQDPRYPDKHLVLHPDNDAVLAICDTKNEADDTVDEFRFLADLIESDPPEAS